MSTDYGEKERQFLETLKADTGRSLDEWMSAIAEEGLRERNEIIDWLRRQGFIMFSKASWIERIYNNGGKAIYADAGTRRARATARPPLPPRRDVEPVVRAANENQSEAPKPTAHAPVQTAPIQPALVQPAPVSLMPASPAPAAPPTAPATPRASDAASAPLSMDALLARAKAYRPLAVYVIAEVGKAVPQVTQRVLDGGIAFGTGEREFAVLAVTAKDLKLGLTLGSPPPGVALEPARLSLRAAPVVTHMAVLTDARQITPALIAAIVQASTGT